MPRHRTTHGLTRRAALLGALAAPLVLTAGGVAAGKTDPLQRTGNDGGRARLRLDGPGGTTHPHHLLLGPGLGLSLSHPVQTLPLNRIDLGGIPGLGSLFVPVPRRQFKGAEPAGALHLSGRTLHLHRKTPLPDVERVILVHRGVVFYPSRRPHAIDVATPAAPGPQVGAAWIKGADLLCELTPVRGGP
ncbi:hypothetical protein SAMN04490248_10156 [Salinihabitans flavidus]|uniref:Uncharacterized protein n=1 Tax=Salinihabitans flavidus TaxID=569882 RepID=A0A1H8LA75_9RHOB|nr:hypothetical protein [Salinihabitans flavidus]SEO01969.1 hypothetical protein SAMN04490248_10156 [Salinihabitans flavidus]